MLDARAIADRLDLRRYPRSWRGRCPSCAYPGNTFSMKPGKAGRLGVYCSNGCTQELLAEAVQTATGNGFKKAERGDAGAAAARGAKQARALALWRGAEPAPGTLADQYLIGRALPGLAASSALRFRGDTPHPEGGRLPALLALVTDAAGEPIAVHRIYLGRDGGKAKIEPQKASIGPVWGGAIRLDPLHHERPLVIGEGAETSASAGRLTSWPAWAAISAGNLERGLVLPPEARRVVIAADPDEPGERAARAAALRWGREGREGAHHASDRARRLQRRVAAPRGAGGGMMPDGAGFNAGPEFRAGDVDAVSGADADAGFTMGEAPPETNDEAIARLAKLPVLEYERVRAAEAEKLGCRAPILDKLVQAARGANDPASGRTVALRDAEPWPEPVSLPELLNALAKALLKHVVMPAEVADVIALWIAHTYAYERFDHTQRLAITSPTKRCGKSTLLDVLRITCRRTLKADNISASGTFRTIEALAPLTLLIDEADSFLPEAEELRGVLNSGFERSGNVIRVIEQNGEHVPVCFATFAPVALAAIGELPATVADRALPIRLARKAAAETATRLREAGARAHLAELARKLTRWARDGAGKLGNDPAIPDALGDREGDISVPLLAIADAAGSAWAARARRALLSVFGVRQAEGEREAGIMLLGDIKLIFDGMCAVQLPSAEICQRLAEMEERPWPEWRHGKPITQPQLARVLRPFGIRPATVRIGNQTPKGYHREAFIEAWDRYFGAPESGPLPGEGGSDPQHRNSEGENSKFGEKANRNTGDPVAERNGTKFFTGNGCCGVADQKGDPRPNGAGMASAEPEHPSGGWL